jgi:CRP/FNR family transcriptional regulator/CRP/FNR family cyclic AMP-dependent transcriptional regulator
LPDELLAQLAAHARRRTYRRGEVIYHGGDPGETLHVLESGTAKVTVLSPHGAETVLRIIGPGECHGELALIDDSPRSATVQALEPVAAVTLHHDDFLNLLRTNQAANERVLASLANKIRDLTTQVSDLAFLDLEGRLAKKLVELAETHGTPLGNAIEIQLPLTQEDLAGMVGATRASVNKLLGWYEDQGLIARRTRRLEITDLPRLRRRVL